MDAPPSIDISLRWSENSCSDDVGFHGSRSTQPTNTQRLRHTAYAYYFGVTRVRIPLNRLRYKRKTLVEVWHTQIHYETPRRATINLPCPQSKDNGAYVFLSACQWDRAPRSPFVGFHSSTVDSH